MRDSLISTSIALDPIDLSDQPADSSVLGVGVDLVSVHRFRQKIQRTERLATQVFTAEELAYASLCSDPTLRLAARFAAKEAVTKALGTGLGVFGLRDVEIVSGERRAPAIVLHGRAVAVAAQQGVTRWCVSMSHVDQMAIAFAVALSDLASPQKPDVTRSLRGSDQIGGMRTSHATER